MTDAPVFVGPDVHDTPAQAFTLGREGKVLVNRPCQNDWQAIGAAVAGHFAEPRGDLAGS